MAAKIHYLDNTLEAACGSKSPNVISTRFNVAAVTCKNCLRSHSLRVDLVEDQDAVLDGLTIDVETETVAELLTPRPMGTPKTIKQPINWFNPWVWSVIIVVGGLLSFFIPLIIWNS